MIIGSRIRFALTAASLLSLLFGNNSLVQAETGVTNKEILLGTCNALSGPSEFAGRETNVGFNTYVNKINAEGGVNGRKIKVISEDDKYEPEAAITAFKKMQNANVFGLAGFYGSTCLARYIPMCSLNKIPALGFYSGPTFVGEPVKRYIFTVRPGYQDEEHQLIEHLWKDMGIRRIAVIYQNDPFGADHLSGVVAQLAKYNAKIVAQASYTRNSDYKKTLRDAYQTVKKANPQAVILAAVYTPAAEVVKMARADKWTPIFTINTGSNVDAFLTEVGNTGDGVICGETVPPPTRTDLPLVAEYVKALKQYYPQEKPCFTSLRGYIDADVYVEGLKRAGNNLTRESLVNALDGLHNIDLGLGKTFELNYSPTDHLGFHKVFFSVIKNGKTVLIGDWKKI